MKKLVIITFHNKEVLQFKFPIERYQEFIEQLNDNYEFINIDLVYLDKQEFDDDIFKEIWINRRTIKSVTIGDKILEK